MRRSATVCIILMGILLVSELFLPQAQSQPGQKAPWQRRLQGTWKREKVILNGKESTMKTTTAFTITFRDNEFSRKSGEKITQEGTFEVDPSKGPAWLDLTATKAGTALLTKQIVKYSFNVTDDTLTLALPIKSKTELKVGERIDTLEPGAGRIIYIYRRVKDSP